MKHFTSSLRRLARALLFLMMMALATPSVSAGWRTDDEPRSAPTAGEKGQALTAASSERAQQDKRAQTIIKASKTATARYVKKIKRTWPQAEISSSSSWVTYSEDFKAKTVVDYAANEIRVSLDRPSNGGRIDFIRTNERVRKQLVRLLRMKIRDGYEKDPVSVEVHRSMKDSKDLLAQLPDELIMSELFPVVNPTAAQIDRLARQLLKEAVISYSQGLAGLLASLPSGLDKKITYSIPMPKDRMLKKAKQYKAYVYEYAKQLNVPADLVFAIIHTESHFNPMARSHIPAFGLMQIVPGTAGRDATKVLFDESKVLSPSYLYNPKQNIQIGTAYLNLLYYRYMAGVNDPTSRLLCTIAAYNAGSVSVAKAFTSLGSMTKAAPIINSMSPQKVLARLKSRLPAKETQDYVRKVMQRQKMYQRI